MLRKIAFGCRVGFLPLPLVAPAPFHPDGFQPGNAVGCERPLLVGRALIFQPGPQPDAALRHIFFRESKISVLFPVGGCLGVKVFPPGVDRVPDNAQFFQCSGLFRIQGTIPLTGLGIFQPVVQRKPSFVLVPGRDIQVTVNLSVTLRGFQPTRPSGLGAGLPHHADAVQPLDLLRRQTAVLFPAAADAALGLHPLAEAQPRRRPVTQRHIQIAVLRVVNACLRKVMVPGRGQTALQLLKQDAAVLHLLDHLKALGDDPVTLAVGVEPLHGGGHLVLQPRDAAQPLEIVDHIQNQRRFGAAGGQRPADLLLINDGRHGGPEQDHARNTLHMDALVQHIDAE